MCFSSRAYVCNVIFDDGIVFKGLHFPLSMMLDFNGYRVLATATLPTMADPRDLIDTTKATSLITTEKSGDDKDGWEVAQEALRARVQVRGNSVHSIW